MTKYEIVPATLEHAKELAANMRAEDAVECSALRLTPLAALHQCLATSRDSRTGLADGRVIAMLGVGEWSALGLYGTPWLLTAAELPRHTMAFARGSKSYFDEIKGRYRILQNYVDARHVQAVKWLSWLGFELGPPEPYGPDGVLFHRFHWEAK